MKAYISCPLPVAMSTLMEVSNKVISLGLTSINLPVLFCDNSHIDLIHCIFDLLQNINLHREHLYCLNLFCIIMIVKYKSHQIKEMNSLEQIQK